MSLPVTRRQILARLDENGIPRGELMLAGGASVIIAQRGGRIFGPFLGEDGESLSWMNPAFADAAAFRAFLASPDWNQGGERLWIAPEVQYHVSDRADFWGSYNLPQAVDPGDYTLEPLPPDGWRLRTEMFLEAHNLASGTKSLAVERTVRAVPDPLRALGEFESLTRDVVFAGYEHVVTLRDRNPNAIASEAWNILQLKPGGTLVIPASPRVEHVDYFEPIDASYQAVDEGFVRLRITGDRRYKVGYKAAHVFGRLAYYRPVGEDGAVLVVRNFFNDPTSPYVEEPPASPGCSGCSVHVYNDGGDLGGFGELECNGRTLGGRTGRTTSTDRFALWLYEGPAERIGRIATHLVGISRAMEKQGQAE